MKNEDIVFWRDAAPLIKEKSIHCRSVKNQKSYSGFGVFNGDIPVVVFNSITGQAMAVVNNRGTAYACRRRLKYRKKK